MNSTHVKICGITRVTDAVASAEAGADAVGMVFWPGSSRAITVERAREICLSLPEKVSTVGVVVNGDPASVMRLIGDTGIRAVQLCGEVCDGDWSQVARLAHIIRAVAIASSHPDEALRLSGVEDYLVDNGTSSTPGGTGKSFDWSLAEPVRAWGRVWLAGGLSHANVGEAIRIVRPYAVDVSSGVEESLGVKSPALIREFIAAVHRADKAIEAEGRPM